MANTYTSPVLSVDVTGEKDDLLALLADQSALFLLTMRDLTEDQARQRTTVSELTLGGLLKHVALVTSGIADDIVARDENAEVDVSELTDAYALGEGETFAQWRNSFEEACTDIERIVAEIDDLGELIPQATAPWQPERLWWPARKMLLHLLREIAHHSGHADIIREALDGQTTMAAVSEGQDWADADWG